VTERSHLTSPGATASTSMAIHEQGSARDEDYSGSPKPSFARRDLSRDIVEEAEEKAIGSPHLKQAPEYPRRVSIKSKAPHASAERGHHLVSEHETKLAYDDRGRSSDVMPQEHLALAAPRNVPRPAKSSIEPAASAPLVVVPATNEPEKRRIVKRFRVNAHLYSVTKKLGKGSSGRVYEVLSDLKELWAFKVIPLQNLDDRSKKQIQNEVSLLRDLRSVDRVIYLHDWVVEESKKALFMVSHDSCEGEICLADSIHPQVMELGECDLDNILRDKLDHQPQLDTVFVGYYWLEMLRCVAAIHDVGVVHSDLKPANFILASGKLKIADFGIANAIPDDIVNAYQEQAAGTPNYMAPETLRAMSRTGNSSLDTRAFRFGKPSDIWSLGCILYLMVYGRQPFGHIQGLGPKAMAIIDPSHQIEFAAHGVGDVQVPSGYLRTMKACLSREPSERPVADACPAAQRGRSHATRGCQEYGICHIT
jgi:serine/threonine-protein kinase TTK/MPS1